MATELRAGLLCTLLLVACSGCFAPRGYLFTHTTMPYTLPYEKTVRTGTKSCSVDITRIKEPFSRANLSVMWTNRAVAEAMKRADMTELSYADLKKISILNGMYERRRLIFYGE